MRQSSYINSLLIKSKEGCQIDGFDEKILASKPKQKGTIDGFKESILISKPKLEVEKILDSKPKEEIKIPVFEESILELTENKYFLANLFDGKKFLSKLLYSGLRDGFEAEKFHQLCDNKGPTITLVKANKTFIF